MLCDECKMKPATVHFTQIVNNKKMEMDLCEQCAAAKGGFSFAMGPSIDLHNFFNGFLNPNLGFEISSPSHIPIHDDMRCQSCGLDYEQFTKTGKFSCADCYERFSERLTPLFRRIHGSTEHTGKIPVTTGSTIRIKRELQQLRVDLVKSIQKEEFERAAEIRDRIYELEKEMDV